MNSNSPTQGTDHLVVPGSTGNSTTSSSTGSNNGRKPKTLYIAHRRSPSELTTLMVEQYNLQRQLEIVQAQQQQIIQQQQQQQLNQQSPSSFTYPLSASPMPPPPPGLTHNRSPSTGGNQSHRRTPSNSSGYNQQLNLSPSVNRSSNSSSSNSSLNNTALGHNRRHSLGLNEAKKAAAIVQSQRNNKIGSPSKLGVNVVYNDDTDSSSSPVSSSPSGNPPSFKFPPGGDLEPPTGLQRNTSHGRSKSLAYGQQTFQFPANSNNSNDNSLLPPVTTFGSGHERRGSNHYRSNSRNFDPNGQVNMATNWRSQQSNSMNTHQRQSSLNNLEPPNFVPGHRSRSSYGGSGSSLSTFLPNVNSGSGPQRKSLFAPYLPQSSLPELISDGRLVTGTLRVNKKNRSDAYVSTDGLLDADIFICGSKDRNRALEGDLVAIELLVVDEVWDSKKEKEEKKRRKDNNLTHKNSSSIINDDIHNDASTTSSTLEAGSPANSNSGSSSNSNNLQRRGSLKQRPTMKKNDDVEVEGQSLLLVEEEEINDEIKPLYAGHVVAVVDRIPGQLFAGTLGLLRPSQAAAAKDKDNGNSNNNHQKAPKIVWFKPTDKKVPLIAIPTEQAPKDFVENHDKYANQTFVASIKRWPITSLHPFGTLVSKLGKVDDCKTEIDSILRDNNFLCDEYPENEEDSLKNYDLPSIEEGLTSANRREFVAEYVISFTQNNEFSDHGLHVKRLSDTKIELGIHIADVTYFVENGSLLDKKAKKRSSSVFLPQKSTHLLPVKVNEYISLKEGERNLAISVIFEIDTRNFEVDDVWIGESIVVPKQKVTYDSVDVILSGGKPKSSDVSSATCDYIRTLSLIAREFRRQRLENKSLNTSPNLTLLDQLDDEKVRLDLNIFKDNLSFDIINEIFHKVNLAVAQKVHSILGEKTLLRRHVLPTLQKMETFVRKATNLGVSIDTTTSATLQNSILSIQDPIKRQCVESLLYKCMSRGKYYIAGKTDPDSYGHYYLNLPLYAHFTAPFRRYADLVTHRQLKAVLNNDLLGVTDDLDSLKMTADYCNFKKDCAKSAQEQAIHLLLSQTINEMSATAGQLLCMGTVVQVYESAFDVFIPEFGIEKRVHGDQLPLVKAEFDKNDRMLELYWEKGIDSATYVPPDEKSSLSYRISIKNKYRAPAIEAAKVQNKILLEKNNIVTDSIIEKLDKLHLSPPQLKLPSLDQSILLSQEDSKSLPSSPISAVPPPNNRTVSSSTLNSSGNQQTSVNPSVSNNLQSVSKINGGMKPYLKDVITRVENEYCIQEIRELKQVPILLRAEIGMALPCLTVRALNPFANFD